MKIQTSLWTLIVLSTVLLACTKNKLCEEASDMGIIAGEKMTAPCGIFKKYDVRFGTIYWGSESQSIDVNHDGKKDFKFRLNELISPGTFIREWYLEAIDPQFFFAIRDTTHSACRLWGFRRPGQNPEDLGIIACKPSCEDFTQEEINAGMDTFFRTTTPRYILKRSEGQIIDDSFKWKQGETILGGHSESILCPELYPWGSNPGDYIPIKQIDHNGSNKLGWIKFEGEQVSAAFIQR